MVNTPPSDGVVQTRRSADKHLTELSSRVSTLEEGMKENTEVTKRIEENTRGIVEAWQAIVGGLQVLAFLAKLAKWAGYIAGAVTAVWALLKFGDSGGVNPKDIHPR